MHHENLAAMIDEGILKLLVGTEILKPVGADEDCLNAFFPEDLVKIVIQSVYLQIQQLEVLDTGFV